MATLVPFAGLDRRTACLRAMLLGACFLGIVASTPVWLSSRVFPLLPLGLPAFPPPWDRALYATLLLALVLAAWRYRAGVTIFLIACLVAFCQDQNRGQPWIYMYCVLLLFTLMPPAVSLASCRLAISIVYFWSGLQKCHARFFEIVPAWFVAPAEHWHLPSWVMQVLRWSVACAPFVELGIALALWSPRLSRWAIGSAALVHLSALLFLGPLGYNYNWVVWPWNIAMVGLVFTLFSTGGFWQPRVAQTSSPSSTSATPAKKAKPSRPPPGAPASLPARSGRFGGVTGTPVPSLMKALGDLRSKAAIVILALFGLLPVLGYAGWWDSYFSFSLYAENKANANIFVTESFAERLPAGLRVHVKPFPRPFDPVHQGPNVFMFEPWAYEELHVPPIPEPRNFRSVYRFLRTYARDPADLRMIVAPRAGPVIFYEAEGFEFLSPR